MNERKGSYGEFLFESWLKRENGRARDSFIFPFVFECKKFRERRGRNGGTLTSNISTLLSLKACLKCLWQLRIKTEKKKKRRLKSFTSKKNYVSAWFSVWFCFSHFFLAKVICQFWCRRWRNKSPPSSFDRSPGGRGRWRRRNDTVWEAAKLKPVIRDRRGVLPDGRRGVWMGIPRTASPSLAFAVILALRRRFFKCLLRLFFGI